MNRYAKLIHECVYTNFTGVDKICEMNLVEKKG